MVRCVGARAWVTSGAGCAWRLRGKLLSGTAGGGGGPGPVFHPPGGCGGRGATRACSSRGWWSRGHRRGSAQHPSRPRVCGGRLGDAGRCTARRQSLPSVRSFSYGSVDRRTRPVCGEGGVVVRALPTNLIGWVHDEEGTVGEWPPTQSGAADVGGSGADWGGGGERASLPVGGGRGRRDAATGVWCVGGNLKIGAHTRGGRRRHCERHKCVRWRQTCTRAGKHKGVGAGQRG